jgi:RHS repeat-associated protein
VGTTKGAFEVNPAGGASYIIPIDVLPGVNGLTPSLSLVYSSNSGPGMAGYGWSIGGLSAIGRTGQTYYNDGAATGVNLTASDKFTIDGQRLVPTSGTYGANLTTYQTEIDNFTRVQSLLLLGTGPASFKAQTKSGVTNLYGNTADSKQLLPGIAEAVNWFVSSTTDLYGNTISYSYLTDNNMVYPSQIIYGLNTITFSYKTRIDITASYLKGQKIQQTLLLDKITIAYNSNIVKSYQMSYNLISDNYNNYSELNEVIEYGIGTSRYNSTAFSYLTPVSATFPQTLASVANSDISYQSRKCTGDFNNDGKAEILCLPDPSKGAIWTGMRIYSGDGTNITTFLSSTNTIDLTILDDIQALDINGDGIDDVVYELNNAGTSSYYYMISNGTTLGTPVLITTMPNDINTGMCGKSRRKNFKQENDNQLSGTDYNGDGVNDIFINDAIGNWKLYSMANSTGALIATLNLLGSGVILNLSGQTLSADFNGDGKAEIWSVEATGTNIYNFAGTTLSLLKNTTVPSIYNFFTLGDFNGDKKADIFIYGDATTDWLNWQVYLSTGTGFDIKSIPQKKANLKNDYVRMGDFNGDGNTDLMVTSSNQSWTGINFYISKNKGTDLYTETLTAYPNELDNFYLADFNGDGRTDFISTNVASPWWSGYKIGQTTGDTSPLLKQVANGLNLLTEILYTKLSEAAPTVYNKGLSNAFPIYYYQGTLPVVYLINEKYDDGCSIVYTYAYNSATVHRQGKGFLGFGGIFKTDSQAQTLTETNRIINNTYFYPQVTNVAVQSTVGGIIYRSATFSTVYNTTNSWTQLVLDAQNKRIYPYIETTTESNSLTSQTSSTTTSLVDNYGNIGQLVKTNSSDCTTTANANYTNTVSATDWKLGLLSSSTVTNTKSGETPVSHTTNFTYSTDGILKPDIITYNPGTNLAYTINHDYDSIGNFTQVLTSGTSIGTSQVNYTYTTDGTRVLTTIDLLGHVTTNTYDTYGRLATQTDYLSNIITYGYDNMFSQTSVSSTLGSQTTTAYLWTGTNKPALAVYGISATGNDGSLSIVWYNNLGRVVRSEKRGFEGSMILTDTPYNAKGQLAQVSVPYFSGSSITWAETYGYDDYSRTESITRNTGRNTTYTYNSNSVSETTAGKTSSKIFDASGLITSASDNGGTIAYAYYADGKTKSITAPVGVVTNMQYDAARNQTQLVDPSAGTNSYTYDALGRVITQTDAKNQLTTNTYLPDGRISTVVNPEGTTTYSYNTNKQLTGISNSTTNVSRTYGYDTKGRVSSITETIAGSNFSTSFTYDSYGRLGTRTHPSGIVETLGYNNGVLSTISAGGSTRYTITSMNARQQLTNATYGSGTTLNATFDFDVYGYPSSSKAGTLQDYRYVFDRFTGNLTSRQNFLRSKSESFTYDNLDRLLTATGPQNLTMTYNINGNINTKSDIGTTAFGYGTAAGPYALTGLTSTTTAIPAVNQTATYTSFEKVATIAEGNYVATILYNSENQRAKMDITQSGTNILTRWYAGSSYMKETAAGVTKEYTYLGGDAYTAPVAAVTQSGTTTYYYLLRDYLGNITHQVNTANTVVAEYSYDAWGRRRNPVDWSYNLTGQPAQFAGRGYTSHEDLPWFNLVNMNGRLYDPLVGRFLNADPVIQDPTNTQNYNLYSYCLNNPLKYVDVSGNSQSSFTEGDPWTNPDWGGHTLEDMQKILFGSVWENIQKGQAFVSGGSTDITNVHYDPKKGIWIGKDAKGNDVEVDPKLAGEMLMQLANNNGYGKSSGQGDGTKYTLGNFNDGLNAVGIFAGSAELFTNANAGARITYTTINGISAWVSSAKVVSGLKIIGNTVFYVSIPVDFSLSLTGNQSWTKSLFNSGVGYACLRTGGWPGLLIGLGYTTIDKTIGWDRALTPAINHPGIFYGPIEGVPLIR